MFLLHKTFLNSCFFTFLWCSCNFFFLFTFFIWFLWFWFFFWFFSFFLKCLFLWLFCIFIWSFFFFVFFCNIFIFSLNLLIMIDHCWRIHSHMGIWVLLAAVLKRIILFLNFSGILIFCCLFSYLINKFFDSMTATRMIFKNFTLWNRSWFWFLAISLFLFLLLVLLLLLYFFILFFKTFNHFVHSFFSSGRRRSFLFLLSWSGSFFSIFTHIFLNFFAFILFISFHHLIFRRSFIFIKSSVNWINIFDFCSSFIESFGICLFIRSRFWFSVDFIRVGKESINVNNILKETPLALNKHLQLIIGLSINLRQHLLFLSSTKTWLLLNPFLYLLLQLYLLS